MPPIAPDIATTLIDLPSLASADIVSIPSFSGMHRSVNSILTGCVRHRARACFPSAAWIVLVPRFLKHGANILTDRVVVVSHQNLHPPLLSDKSLRTDILSVATALP